MRIDLPTCDIKYCRYFCDNNCIAEKLKNERCHYTILQNEVRRLGYIDIYGTLVKDKNNKGDKI